MGLTRNLMLVFAAYTACAHATCYNPNGDEAKDDTPCFPDRTNSTCCGTGLACLSNNLCGITSFPSNPKSTFGLGEWFVRGSCTDRSFTDPACFNRCLRSANGDLYNVFTPVRQCLAGNRNRWYCSNTQTREQTLDEVCFTPSQADESLFQMDGNPSTVTVIGHEKGTATAADTLPSSSSSTTTTSSNSASSSSTTPATMPNPPAESKPDYRVPVGVGVGAPLGVLSMGILGYLYFRNRRQAAEEQSRLQGKENPYVQEAYAYRAELSDWSRAGELSTSADPHELSAERNRNSVK